MLKRHNFIQCFHCLLYTSLPGGASYKVLVLPLARPMNLEPVLSSEVQKKINELKEAGILVPSLPYTEEDFSVYGLELSLIHI